MDTDYRPPAGEADRIRAALTTHMIGLSVGVGPAAMAAPRLGPRACRARWSSMYLAHVGFGWPLDRVAYAFGVNRATAGIGCRWAEDERDTPAYDEMMDRLERMLRELCDAPRLELTR